MDLATFQSPPLADPSSQCVSLCHLISFRHISGPCRSLPALPQKRNCAWPRPPCDIQTSLDRKVCGLLLHQSVVQFASGVLSRATCRDPDNRIPALHPAFHVLLPSDRVSGLPKAVARARLLTAEDCRCAPDLPRLRLHQDH